MNQSELKEKTLKGIYWNILETSGRNLFRLLFGILLARLLDPSDFGLIGMVAVFISIAGLFIDSGLGAALIQDSKADQKDYSTVFLFNVVTGVILYIVLFILAPYIAVFYNVERLTPIIRIVSLTLIINSFGIVQNAVLTKSMNFRSLSLISLTGIILSGACGIFMAIAGYGVWSLVAQGLLKSILTMLLLWIFSDLKFHLSFSYARMKKLAGFGTSLMFTNFINVIFQNIYFLLIGKVYTSDQLGYYTRAERFAKSPVQGINNIFQKVFFPALSTIQDENERLKIITRKLTIIISFVVFPVMFGLAVLAKPMILFLLTDKWSAAIPYMRILCIVFVMYPFHVINLNILKIKGHTDIMLKLEFIKKAIIIVSIILTIRSGIIAILIGQLMVSILAFFINSFYSGKLINYNYAEQIRDILPNFLLAALVSTVIFLPSLAIENNFILLSVQVISGSLLYLIFSRLLNLSGYFEVKEFTRPYLLSFFNALNLKIARFHSGNER